MFYNFSSFPTSKRKYFTGAITNGLVWKFYIAEVQEDGYKIYSSYRLQAVQSESIGHIVAILMELVSYSLPFPPRLRL